jgi:hypothetical protein
MTRRNAMNVFLETSISHAVFTAQQALCEETPLIDRQEISRATLSAIARLAAQEIMTVEQCANPNNVIECMPEGPGSHFWVEMQDELRRLHDLKCKRQ